MGICKEEVIETARFRYKTVPTIYDSRMKVSYFLTETKDTKREADKEAKKRRLKGERVRVVKHRKRVGGFEYRIYKAVGKRRK